MPIREEAAGGTLSLTINGIASINGDTTAAQALSVSSGLALIEVPGAHAISGIPFAGAGTPGIVPDPGAAAATDYLAADATFKPIPPAFAVGTPGLVSDPATAPITDVLCADNTFRTAVLGINSDATYAQTFNAANGLRVSDTGGGIHVIGLATLSVRANNAAALAAGLVAGDLYRTGADPDVVCVVH